MLDRNDAHDSEIVAAPRLNAPDYEKIAQPRRGDSR
jgi:hypothetical protein